MAGINLTGSKIGFLTVIGPASKLKGKKRWLCRCICSRQIPVFQSSLTRKNPSRSCGCRNGADLSGQIFGALTALEPVIRADGVRVWRCQCGCGNETLVRAQSLVAGHTVSCGCVGQRKRLEGLKKSWQNRKAKPKQSKAPPKLKYIDLTGQTFGRLKVIERCGRDPHNAAQWKCLCSCGKEIVTTQYPLRKGLTQSCGCIRRRTYIGEKFGRWLVLSESKKIGRNQYFLCRCDCGTEKDVSREGLRSGNSKSCGCLNLDNIKTMTESRRGIPGESGKKELYTRYKKSASTRNLAFEITFEDFKRIIAGNCVFCGAPPSNLYKMQVGKHGVSAEWSEFTKFKYNGIDRMDNNAGYIDGNVCACCFICNSAKRNQDPDSFRNWINRLVRHQIITGSSRMVRTIAERNGKA